MINLKTLRHYICLHLKIKWTCSFTYHERDVGEMWLHQTPCCKCTACESSSAHARASCCICVYMCSWKCKFKHFVLTLWWYLSLLDQVSMYKKQQWLYRSSYTSTDSCLLNITLAFYARYLETTWEVTYTVHACKQGEYNTASRGFCTIVLRFSKY